MLDMPSYERETNFIIFLLFLLKIVEPHHLIKTDKSRCTSIEGNGNIKADYRSSTSNNEVTMDRPPSDEGTKLQECEEEDKNDGGTITTTNNNHFNIWDKLESGNSVPFVDVRDSERRHHRRGDVDIDDDQGVKLTIKKEAWPLDEREYFPTTPTTAASSIAVVDIADSISDHHRRGGVDIDDDQGVKLTFKKEAWPLNELEYLPTTPTTAASTELSSVKSWDNTTSNEESLMTEQINYYDDDDCSEIVFDYNNDDHDNGDESILSPSSSSSISPSSVDSRYLTDEDRLDLEAFKSCDSHDSLFSIDVEAGISSINTGSGIQSTSSDIKDDNKCSELGNGEFEGIVERNSQSGSNDISKISEQDGKLESSSAGVSSIRSGGSLDNDIDDFKSAAASENSTVYSDAMSSCHSSLYESDVSLERKPKEGYPGNTKTSSQFLDSDLNDTLEDLNATFLKISREVNELVSGSDDTTNNTRSMTLSDVERSDGSAYDDDEEEEISSARNFQQTKHRSHQQHVKFSTATNLYTMFSITNTFKKEEEKEYSRTNVGDVSDNIFRNWVGKVEEDPAVTDQQQQQSQQQQFGISIRYTLSSMTPCKNSEVETDDDGDDASLATLSTCTRSNRSKETKLMIVPGGGKATALSSSGDSPPSRPALPSRIVTNECGLCLARYKPGDVVVWTDNKTSTCKHVFHECCITSYFIKVDRGTCPCCRQVFIYF